MSPLIPERGNPKNLAYCGFDQVSTVLANLNRPELYAAAVRRGEGTLAIDGPLVVETGKYTGRSPKDRFIVRESSSMDEVGWSATNLPFEEADFESLLSRMRGYLQGREIFVQDCFAGADPQFRIPLRAITELAWHSLFARNMFIPAEPTRSLTEFDPEWHVIYAPGCSADPASDGTRSEAFIVLHFGRKMILIGGTSYGGEMKKAIFSVLNFVLPRAGILSMHCSANMGANGETALFFGLSGTGKTTLSASADRVLIGDDEHGWSDNGIFNFEGGCYAKVIRLSEEAEPEIYSTTGRFGTVLENVVMNPTSHLVDLDDDSITENTRASYPIEFIPHASADGRGGHPTCLIMLTCDAFGVLPPVAHLTTAQAMYHFLSGYTAKVAGTERGVAEPTATFSPCFGGPFMVLPPIRYAQQLGAKVSEHRTSCWLVNTGWSGGPYGEGERISIQYTRAIIRAILQGRLANAQFETDPLFKIDVPTTCPEVPTEILRPRATWRDGQAYDRKAADLVRLFNEHFAAYEADAPELMAVAPGTD